MTDIMIVGEAWGAREEEKGRPFVGPSGGLLNVFLAAHGIERRDCYLTNVFNFRPPANKISALCVQGRGTAALRAADPLDPTQKMPAIDTGKYVRKEYENEISRLYRECEAVDPTLILALGGTACWALLHDRRIKRLRGAPVKSITGHKVLATYHPAAVLREYKLRPIVFADFEKAAREAQFKEIRRPQRELWLEPTVADLVEFHVRFIADAPRLSVDSETFGRQITCIGFAPSEEAAIVVPFVSRKHEDKNYWRTKAEELEAWSWVRRWLNSGKQVFGQNFLYDCRYLWEKYGIPIRTPTDDTMLLHHALQPEMQKDLGFLGSIYTDEPGWKFMRQGKGTLKKED